MDELKHIRITRDDVLGLAATYRLAGSEVFAEIMAKREGEDFADVQITFTANGYELIAALTCGNDVPDDADMEMGEPEVVEALLEGCVIVDCFSPWPHEQAGDKEGE